MMMDKLAKEVVIVTGAAQGIGRATTDLILEEGGRTVLVDLSATGLEEATASIVKRHPDVAERIVSIPADICTEKACGEVVQRAVEHFGRITALVNNAGIIYRTTTLDTSLKEWREVVDVNLTGTFLMTKAASQKLSEEGDGCIVNVSSRAAKRPHPHASPAYGATKAAILYLTRHWALEFAAAGIRVNAVCPGPVATEMFLQLDEDLRIRTAQSIPRGSVGTTREIAEVIVFLLSSNSSYINGETIHINGGSYME